MPFQLISEFTSAPKYRGAYSAEVSKRYTHIIDRLESCVFNVEMSQARSVSLSLYMFVLGCEKEAGTSMWIYVFLGNLLRGIGETPIQPLGITYIDDYASEESAAFYIGKNNYVTSLFS